MKNIFSKVRQLESLIRLSEAYARLKCAPEVIKFFKNFWELKIFSKVLPEHVTKATKLLSETIVRMGSKQISLEEEDDVSFWFLKISFYFSNLTNNLV